MFFIIGSLELIFIQSTSGHNIEDEKQGTVACNRQVRVQLWELGSQETFFLSFSSHHLWDVGCVISLPELMGKTPLIVFFVFFSWFLRSCTKTLPVLLGPCDTSERHSNEEMSHRMLNILKIVNSFSSVLAGATLLKLC